MLRTKKKLNVEKSSENKKRRNNKIQTESFEYI